MERSGADQLPLDPFATLPRVEQRRLAMVLSEAIVRTPPDDETYKTSLVLLEQLIRGDSGVPKY
jgi:hypothetical protein